MSDQVICIDDSLPKHGYGWRGDAVFKGKIYTVREAFIYLPTGDRALILEEVRSTPVANARGEVGYMADRFRPVKDSSLDIFRELVKPVLEDA